MSEKRKSGLSRPFNQQQLHFGARFGKRIVGSFAFTRGGVLGHIASLLGGGRYFS